MHTVVLQSNPFDQSNFQRASVGSRLPFRVIRRPFLLRLGLEAVVEGKDYGLQHETGSRSRQPSKLKCLGGQKGGYPLGLLAHVTIS